MNKLFITIALSSCGLLASAASGPFHAVVAADGSGDYKTVSEAIANAPEGRTEPWLILVKKGNYVEHVSIPASKPYIHLIGQDKQNTAIRMKQNVGGKPNGSEKPGKTAYWDYSVHNPESKNGAKGFAVVVVEAPHFYTEGISYINDWGVESHNGPQALAMRSNADCGAFNDCIFRSFQDTWYTVSADTARHYVKDCFIEGAVDYFYGGGDVLAVNCTFNNVRGGSVIVAPSHGADTKYGYAFVNCTIDGTPEAADGKLKLGRPWHNRPKVAYINTTALIPIAEEGWSDMGTIAALFAECNTHDSNGNPIDLSKRKSTYKHRNRETGEEYTGSCPNTITAEEAAKYTYENMILAKDGWNPREMMVKLNAPKGMTYTDGVLTWDGVKDAAGYVVYDGDEIIATTTDTSCSVPQINTALMVRAVNKFGSLGKLGVL